MDNESFSDIAKGALVGANFRRYMSPTSERIAELTNARGTALTFFDSVDEERKALAWLPLFYEVRGRGLTIQLKKLIERTGIKNVLEVGAGVDVERALDVIKNPEVNYIMSDYSSRLVEMQRALVQELAPEGRNNLKNMRLDALNEEETRRAIESFNGQRHIKVSDGLLAIFTAEERDKYLDIARKTNATIITNDIFTRERLELLVSRRLESVKLLAKLHGVKGLDGINQAELIDEVFSAYETLYDNLEQHGFGVQRVLLYKRLGYGLNSPSALGEREGITVDVKDVENAISRSAWILTPKE